MKIKSITDVITNSSTEVFIVKKEEIQREDLKHFTIYNNLEEVYNLASKWKKDSYDLDVMYLIEEIYDIINNTNYEYYVCIEGFLEEYGLGGTAYQLGMNLCDVLKLLEPLWKDTILNSGYYSFSDDSCNVFPEWVYKYKMAIRR